MNVLLDTSLLITGFDPRRVAELGDARFFTSALCYAELAEGERLAAPVAAAQAGVQLENARALCGPGLPFADREPRLYRVVCATVASQGRELTRSRRVDPMIATTALSNDMAIGTRNIKDSKALHGVLDVVEL